MQTEEQKQKRKEYLKEYYQRPHVKKKRKAYYQIPEIKEKQKEYYKGYSQRNKKRNKKRIKEYRQTTKGKQSINSYQRQRKKTNIDYYLICKLRCQVKLALRKYSNTGKIMTSKKYGIDYKSIIEHLKPFPKDLRDLDLHHIKQLVKFKFINKDGSTNLEEIRKAFTPENLILLTKEEHKKAHNGCSWKRPLII